jgi:putative oxidoreductase
MTTTTDHTPARNAGLESWAAPVGRLMLAAIFVIAGINKLGGYAGVQGYMEAFGIPGALLPVVIALEIAGGLALAAGYQARLAAVLLGAFSLVSGAIFHLLPGLEAEGLAAQNDINHFLKNVALAGGMALIVAFGPGRFSLHGR